VWRCFHGCTPFCWRHSRVRSSGWRHVGHRTCQRKMLSMPFAGEDRHRIPIRRTPERIGHEWVVKTVGSVHILIAVAALCEVVVQRPNRRQVLNLRLRRAPILTRGAAHCAHHHYGDGCRRNPAGQKSCKPAMLKHTGDPKPNASPTPVTASSHNRESWPLNHGWGADHEALRRVEAVVAILAVEAAIGEMLWLQAEVKRCRSQRTARHRRVKPGPKNQGHASFAGPCDTPALDKLLQFKPRRTILKLLPRLRLGACLKCGHRKALHVIHPDGTVACEARRCSCRLHRWNG